MRILLDATVLIGLGPVGELGLLTSFDGTLVCCPAVRQEVTTEPARTNLERFREAHDIGTDCPEEGPHLDRAAELLGEDELSGDVQLVAACLSARDADTSVALVSDDRRLRTVADGLGATVTGTIGAIVRAVNGGLPASEGVELVRRLDDRGLHMTAELRHRAEELVRDAGDGGSG
ncbi:hypothetical protein DP107_02935 [Haloglomus irregulare]|mgnify:CR=1 FL=1|jgi:predicted nucleic acid-binding protein|uniref:Nucleic acid-binding protein, contains PIN domain n=1 Tax=Haloglomus irregulare TaxID=2234134 RepID=A0A554NFG7_9EURY|nr:hypothetical protein [Haloglomus irregulare]TSD16142.1 hypothetical protein DP107_02935 [Haloglomus irregulare]